MSDRPDLAAVSELWDRFRREAALWQAMAEHTKKLPAAEASVGAGAAYAGAAKDLLVLLDGEAAELFCKALATVEGLAISDTLDALGIPEHSTARDVAFKGVSESMRRRIAESALQRRTDGKR